MMKIYNTHVIKFKGKQRKTKQEQEALLKELGGDSYVVTYVEGIYDVVECIWYTSSFRDSKTKEFKDRIVLLPYVKQGEHLIWTEDKITFPTLAQAKKFCTLINCKLIKDD